MKRTRREEGQAVTAVAIAAVLITVAAALGMITQFGKGISEVSKIKSGADSAALAGAQDVIDRAWNKIDASLRSTRNEFLCGDGQGRASRYASKNSTSHVLLLQPDVRPRRGTGAKHLRHRDWRGRVGSVCGGARSPAGALRRHHHPVPDRLLHHRRLREVLVDVYVDSGGEAHLITPETVLKKMFRVTLGD